MAYVIPPAKSPTGYRTPEAHAAIQRANIELVDACDIVSRILTKNAATLSNEGRYKLRNVWAYLHECYCADGKRPKTPIIAAELGRS